MSEGCPPHAWAPDMALYGFRDRCKHCERWRCGTCTCGVGPWSESGVCEACGGADLGPPMLYEDFKRRMVVCCCAEPHVCIKARGAPPDPDESPFRKPPVTSGYPLDPEEQEAVDRLVRESGA